MRLAGIALVGLATLATIHWERVSDVKSKQQGQLNEVLVHASGELEEAMAVQMHTVMLLGALQRSQPQFLDAAMFLSYARDLHALAPAFRTLQVADSDCVIRYTWPLEGNEAAIGLHLMDIPYVKTDLTRAIEKRRLVVSSPITTIQGSKSIVARMPVFRDGEFIGLAGGVLDVEVIAKWLHQNVSPELGFRLLDSRGAELASSGVKQSTTLTRPLTVAGETWHLTGWWVVPPPEPVWNYVALWSVGLVILGLILAIVHVRGRHYAWMSEEVATQTAAFQRQNNELDATLKRTAQLASFREQMLDSPLIWICVTSPDGQVLYWNRGAEQITGYTAEEATKADIWHVLYPNAAEETLRQFRDTFEQKGRVEGTESTITNSRGEARIIAWYATLLEGPGEPSFLIVGTDVTATRESASQLAASEARFRLVFEHAFIGLAIIQPDGHFLRVNEHFTALLGYDLGDLTHKHFHELLHPDDLHLSLDILESANHSGAAERRLETRFTAADNTEIWADVAITPYCNENGHFMYFFVAVLDITDRKLQEFELREARAKLELAIGELQTTQKKFVHQERMRALGEMASGIAHDFNNNLAVISGYTELLQHRLVDIPSDALVYLNQISLATEDAASTVSRMREFYRDRNAVEPTEPIDLTELIPGVISLTTPHWRTKARSDGREIHMETDLRPHPPLQGNPSDLREIVTNLIINSVDAMPQGGTLTLAVRNIPGSVCLEARDTGIGMSEEIRRRCLEPFFTTKGQNGTGLGLAVTHGIIERHRGAIEIESSPGNGTTVRLTFPCDSTVVSAPKTVPPVASAPPDASSYRLLIVDDEAPIRTMLGEILTLLGHSVTLACDGEDALKHFSPGEFDLLLTDRSMPKMSGDILAQRVHALDPFLPIIMLTGFGSLMNLDNELPIGVRLVIAKPITVDALRDAIEEAMAN